MAQVCFQPNDLRKALLGVPRLAVGVSSLSNMLRINIVKELSGMTMFESAILEIILSVVAENIENTTLNLLKKYFNTYPPFQFDEALLSGSWSEGLTLYKIRSDTPEVSDMDFMCILKNISFSEEDQACGNLTVKEDTPFVNAYITNQELLKMWKDFLVEDPLDDKRKSRLSSRKLKEMLHENYKKMGDFFEGGCEKCKPIGDGPSLELKMRVPNLDSDDPDEFFKQTVLYTILSSSDIVLSIRCDGWPSNVWEWIERERVWPDKDLVQKICENGFHIVPKSSPEGNFRLSFSKAETTLIENLTPLQHKVLRAFKAVIKYHQSNWSPNIKDMICTYSLKTIAFWHFEKSTQDSWTEDNVVSHLLSLLDEFAQALRDGNLPMYFLPKYNLFGKFEDPEDMRKISGKVVELSRDLAAITIAVNEVAYVKHGEVVSKGLVSGVTEYFDREEAKKAAKEGGAESGNEPRTEDESIFRNGPDWRTLSKALGQLADVMEMSEASQHAIEDVLLYCLDSQHISVLELFRRLAERKS